jgi:hypothetical protein
MRRRIDKCQIACATSSIAFQAKRLLSLEQWTSCVCGFVSRRLLESSQIQEVMPQTPHGTQKEL